MATKSARTTRAEKSAVPQSGLVALTKELWQAAVPLRGSIEPADHKRYVLTPGRYVGSANGEEDDTPFEERFPKLVTELEAQFAKSDKLQKEIRTQLARVTATLKNGKA